MAKKARSPQSPSSRAADGIRSVLGLKGRSLAAVSADDLVSRGRERLLETARAVGIPKAERLGSRALADRILRQARGPGAARRPGAPRPAARRKRESPPPSEPPPARTRRRIAQPAAPGGDARRRSPATARGGRQRATRSGGRSAAPPVSEAAVAPALRAKFEVGPSDERPPRQIPWSYGRDRITAMVVDPDRLFVYWEVRDDSIEDARRRLGPGGPGAWLSLRVYDITGRIFDGTNAHRYSDVKVERGDRQWFVHVGQPDSTWCVEIGMKSREGYFQRIARSGRADFPRREPSRHPGVEWMTVRVHSGETSREARGPSAAAAAVPAWTSPGLVPHGPVFGVEEHGTRHFVAVTREDVEAGGFEERHEIRHQWTREGMHLEWHGPVTRTTWDAGPFPVPVEPPPYSEERRAFEGPVRIETIGGRTRIVHGPWQVSIRGIDAHAERRVLATWQIETSWVTDMTREGVLATLHRWRGPGGPGGASEGLSLGASERLLLRGSEIRLRGASELYLLGASERLWGGASEILFGAASEVFMRGASERRMLGASEMRLLGASENLFAGASEQAYFGASELTYGGASERAYGGASEAVADAAEDWPDPRLP